MIPRVRSQLSLNSCYWKHTKQTLPLTLLVSGLKIAYPFQIHPANNARACSVSHHPSFCSFSLHCICVQSFNFQTRSSASAVVSVGRASSTRCHWLYIRICTRGKRNVPFACDRSRAATTCASTWTRSIRWRWSWTQGSTFATWKRTEAKPHCAWDQDDTSNALPSYAT